MFEKLKQEYGFKRLKKKIAYRVKRLRVRWRRFSKPALYVDNADAKKSITIIENLIANGESELLYAPISHKKYIKNHDIFVVIDQTSVRIINGIYCYEFVVTDKVIDMLSEKFCNRLERDRMKMEKEINTKVHRSLDRILEDVKTHFKNSNPDR